MRIVRLFIVVWASVGLAGCAGRAPQPVAVVQPQDNLMDCVAIAADVQANNAKIQDLASERGEKVAQNVAAGVAGLFIWPLWFGMDFQGAASTEVTALQSRQEYLGSLGEQKRCGASPAVTATYTQPRAGTAAPPVPGAAPVSSADPSRPGRVVLFPVTVYNPYYPPSVYVNFQ